MPHFLFRSRWIAIVWVAGVLLSVSYFFGGEGQGALGDLAAKMRARKAQAEAPVQRAPVVAPAPPPRVVIREVDDPEELEHYREMARDSADRSAAHNGTEEGPSDTYVMIDGAAAVQDATDEDLRRAEEER